MSTFEQIKQNIDVSAFIRHRYPQLDIRQEGNVHKILCPHHPEKTPSCSIFPDGGYKCFGGCGAHGDIFDLIQQIEGVDNKDAARIAGDFIGMTVQFTPPNPHHEAHKEVMTQHNRRYYEELIKNKTAMDYLTIERGLTIDTINEFRLGLVPHNEGQIRQDLFNIGGRLAFPMLEQKAVVNGADIRTIGMGYRTLIDEDPKYKNDKNHDQESDPLNGVFIKSKTLYGYSKAKSTIKQQGFAYIVEGYMDVISMHQSGFYNTLGLMTASMTAAQMEILRGLTDTLILFLDGDKAGLAGLRRILPNLLETGFTVMAIILEDGMDPADLCLERNFEWQNILMFLDQQSMPAVRALIDLETRVFRSYIEKARLDIMGKMYPLIGNVQNKGEREFFESYLKKQLQI